MNHLKLEQLPKKVQEAFHAALRAQKRAYAPFSNYRVGAALGIRGADEVIPGCNVENASFGATVCAERTALLSAIARNGVVDFDFLVVITQDDPPAVPCALCLQSLAEFCDPDLPIYLANPQEKIEKLSLRDLLPRPFSSRTLGSSTLSKKA